MRQKAACRRPKKRADTLIEFARAKLRCRKALHIFILALRDETRDALRQAYRRYLEKGTLVHKVREFIYRALHGLVPALG